MVHTGSHWSVAAFTCLPMLVQVRVGTHHSTMQHGQGIWKLLQCLSKQVAYPGHREGPISWHVCTLCEGRSMVRQTTFPAQAGADMNIKTRAGKATPLHRAAYMGHSAVAKAL